MKNVFSIVFKVFFVVGLPITFITTVSGLIILGPWMLGFNPLSNNIGPWFVCMCFSSSVALGLCFARLTFTPAFEEIPILPEYNPFVVGVVRVMNFMLNVIHLIATLMVRGYEACYTQKFRLAYLALNAAVLGLGLTFMSLFQSHIKLAVDLVSVTSVALIMMVTALSAIQMTMLESQQLK